MPCVISANGRPPWVTYSDMRYEFSLRSHECPLCHCRHTPRHTSPSETLPTQQSVCYVSQIRFGKQPKCHMCLRIAIGSTHKGGRGENWLMLSPPKVHISIKYATQSTYIYAGTALQHLQAESQAVHQIPRVWWYSINTKQSCGHSATAPASHQARNTAQFLLFNRLHSQPPILCIKKNRIKSPLSHSKDSSIICA